jgi:cytochrome c oxidase subunit 2
VLFFKGFKTYMQQAVAPGDAIEYSLTAQKWDWTLSYTNGAIVTENKMIGSKASPIFYLPADRPIKFRMNSADVIHAFWVPDYRIKFDVYPNRYTMVWLRTEPAGELTGRLGKDQGVDEKSPVFGKPFNDHHVFCAEYCGDMHSEMTAIIRVVDETTYADWARLSLDRLPLAELGAVLHQTKCVTCHSVAGTKNVGPTWKDLYGHAVEFTDGTSYTTEQMSDTTFFANYVRESMLEPAKHVVKGFPNQMTSFQGILREKEIDALIAFMKTISSVKPPADPAAEPAPDPAAPKPAETPAAPAAGH